MPPSNLTFVKIGPESDGVLRHLVEHYLHDMAEWFRIDIQTDGSYSYDTSLIWERGYDAYLAKIGDAAAGFALAGSADEWLGRVGARDVHEFFVMRGYRRSGVGQRMATLLWNELPGEWLVRVLELNAPAVLFWRAAISSYSRGSYSDEGRVIKGRSWRFFRFVSKA